jgi:hypothetical protein
MKTTNQVMEGLKANGIDIGAMLNGFVGGAAVAKMVDDCETPDSDWEDK